ncbi:MAG TPA: LysE family translocator [Anaeromyxobacter sp.]|nr:LysE family translocator [Anaeromyxobacter sp.]
MPDPHALLLFVGAGLLLNVTPGPDLLYVLGRSVGQGRAAGVLSALGIGMGCLVHVTAATLGLSALLLALPHAFDLVRWAGAAYLVLLGLRTLRARGGTLAVQALSPVSRRRVLLQGALTNVLNPKVALFFLAFLPQFADPARGPLAPQLLLLGTIFTVNGSLVCVAFALFAAELGAWLRTRYGVSRTLERMTGGLFLALGLRLALLERR